MLTAGQKLLVQLVACPIALVGLGWAGIQSAPPLQVPLLVAAAAVPLVLAVGAEILYSGWSTEDPRQRFNSRGDLDPRPWRPEKQRERIDGRIVEFGSYDDGSLYVSTQVPPGWWLRPENVIKRMAGGSGDDIHTGDAAFDASFEIDGDPSVARAALGPEVRAQIRDASKWFGVSVADGVLLLTYRQDLFPRTKEAMQRAARIARGMSGGA